MPKSESVSLTQQEDIAAVQGVADAAEKNLLQVADLSQQARAFAALARINIAAEKIAEKADQ
ncbi:unnamed protein product, partial [Amoebophrya sp. A25]|eukprot:GSA25T00001502001.1